MKELIQWGESCDAITWIFKTYRLRIC